MARPVPVKFTTAEGGEWHPFEERTSQTIYYSLQFSDGSIFNFREGKWVLILSDVIKEAPPSLPKPKRDIMDILRSVAKGR